MEGVVFPFFFGELVDGSAEFVLVLAFLCWLVGLALVTVVCFFLRHEPPT